MALPVYPGPGNSMPPRGQTSPSGTMTMAVTALLNISSNATRNFIELETLALAEQSINEGYRGTGRDFQFNGRGLGVGRGATR